MRRALACARNQGALSTLSVAETERLGMGRPDNLDHIFPLTSTIRATEIPQPAGRLVTTPVALRNSLSL